MGYKYPYLYLPQGTSMNPNPLSQYFRQPAIYVRLPSQGKHYPANTLETTPNGEYPVLPMTTLDEITYRTPDALFNGQAVVTVIGSCMPNIRDAWSVPSTDIDTILVSIRIATYGHEMDFEVKCPKCEHEDSFGLDLRNILAQISTPDYQTPLTYNDLQIYFRPMTYKEMNENNLAQFEEQKRMVMLDEVNSQEEKSKQIGEVLKHLTDITVGALSQNIAAVKTPNALVTDREHIREWLSNCDRKLFGLIRDAVLDLKQSGEIPPIDVKCTSCGHESKQPFTLNMSDFFEAAS